MATLKIEVSDPDHKWSAYPAPSPGVRVSLAVLPEHACPYIPGRMAMFRAFYARQLSGATYLAAMNAGFRRSGRVVYQPVCRGCRQCVSIRVPVKTFRPNSAQRRCWRRNQDLKISYHRPECSDEKFALYRRYQVEWHGSAEPDSRRAMEEFLYDSPVESLEFEYRDASGALLAVGVCDVCPGALSSVYFYFDPAYARRGLGTFGALYEIAFAAEQDLDYYYPGFWIESCGAMRYKADFRPNEALRSDGQWRPLRS
jgi:arginyl-tRNA--protein-N-Asp/Glu arginylyltransferase